MKKFPLLLLALLLLALCLSGCKPVATLPAPTFAVVLPSPATLPTQPVQPVEISPPTQTPQPTETPLMNSTRTNSTPTETPTPASITSVVVRLFQEQGVAAACSAEATYFVYLDVTADGPLTAAYEISAVDASGQAGNGRFDSSGESEASGELKFEAAGKQTISLRLTGPYTDPEGLTVQASLNGQASSPAQVPCGKNAPSSAAACTTDAAEFVTDVTIPDGTTFKPDEKFIKSWRVKNTGECTWGPEYQLVRKSGDPLGSQVVTPLISDGSVAPGASYDITIELQAPTLPGEYRTDWNIQNAAGEILDFVVYVEIKVSQGASTPMNSTPTPTNATPAPTNSAPTNATPTNTAPTSTSPPVSVGIPGKPTSLIYAYTCTIETGTIEFFWSDASDNEDGFRLYRNGSLVATVAANSTSYTDNVPLNSGTQTTVTYRLAAFNAAGEASASALEIVMLCKKP